MVTSYERYEMTRRLILTRGLPSSGKTTKALEWVNGDRSKRARVNRDEMRQALFGTYTGLDWKEEQAVTQAQRASAKALLEGGRSVVIDDTNLKLKYAREWATFAEDLGATFTVIDMETPVDECVRRDKLRGEAGGRAVGEEVIRNFHSRYGSGNWPEVTPDSSSKRGVDFLPTPYSSEEGLPTVWLFDIDGTIAHNSGHRGWYEYDKVDGDTAWPEVIRVLKALVDGGDEVIFLSGRDESCRAKTRDWIWIHAGIAADDKHLLMRQNGDKRKDTIVKAELFDQHIRGRYNVHGVFDDRPSVTRMWRVMGHRVFHVGDPYKEF